MKKRIILVLVSSLLFTSMVTFAGVAYLRVANASHPTVPAKTAVHAKTSAKKLGGDLDELDVEAASGGCGVERWSVKTGTDADASLVDLLNPTATTIADLTSLSAPSSIPSDSRIQPTETTLYQVTATLDEFKLESDSDYHLVLDDGNGNTMIAEIPSPSCVDSSSPFLTGIESARNEFDNQYSATTSFQTADASVTVTGVGFFDFYHGQTGVAPNVIELHPVIDIQFN
jgi:hypothetical protein